MAARHVWGFVLQFFDFNNDEGVAFVIEGADGDEECVDEAIASCPAECIHKD